jgi:hypothetical protein
VNGSLFSKKMSWMKINCLTRCKITTRSFRRSGRAKFSNQARCFTTARLPRLGQWIAQVKMEMHGSTQNPGGFWVGGNAARVAGTRSGKPSDQLSLRARKSSRSAHRRLAKRLLNRRSRFYNNLEQRGDCQNTCKSYKTSPFVSRIMGWKFALQYLWYDHYWRRGVRLELSPSPVDSGGIGDEPIAFAVLLV